jgi:hypothetical protein
MILFLDFDGVLHPSSVFMNKEGQPALHSTNDSLSLFCWSHYLIPILQVNKDLQIVVSSTWALYFGLEGVKARLPASIARRVVDTTASYQTDFEIRGEQVEQYVKEHGIERWLALDDYDYKWPESSFDNLIFCHPEYGLSKQETMIELIKKIEEQCLK